VGHGSERPVEDLFPTLGTTPYCSLAELRPGFPGRLPQRVCENRGIVGCRLTLFPSSRGELEWPAVALDCPLSYRPVSVTPFRRADDLGVIGGRVALRVALTTLSVYRVIGCPPNLKIETITSPFDGSLDTLPIWEVRQSITRLGVTLKGLRPASPNLFSEAAGPNYPRATWSSGLDALAFWCAPLQWWHLTVIAIRSRSWLVYTWLVSVMLIRAPVIPLLAILGCMPYKLGRLTKLYEAAGKVRVVAKLIGGLKQNP
jgi:hypothetical protein